MSQRPARPHRFIALSALLAVGLLAGCSKSTPEATPPPVAESPAPVEPTDGGGDLEGSWTVAAIDGTDVPNGVKVTMDFKGSEVSGKSGCNTYGGKAEIEGSSLTFGATRSTMMACEESMETEVMFQQAMTSVTSFAREGSAALLKNGDGTTVLMLEAA